MAERETCLVISASTWFELAGSAPEADLGQYEYKVRCRIVIDGSEVLLVHPDELADTSGQFRRLNNSLPMLVCIPRFKLIREEPWEGDSGT